jgi:hypothetical protein
VLAARTTRYSVVVLLTASTVLSHAQEARNQGSAAADRILALDPRWTVAFDTPAAAAAGFDQEAAYVPLEGGTLVAIDLERGRVRWQIALATSVGCSRPLKRETWLPCEPRMGRSCGATRWAPG